MFRRDTDSKLRRPGEFAKFFYKSLVVHETTGPTSMDPKYPNTLNVLCKSNRSPFETELNIFK